MLYFGYFLVHAYSIVDKISQPHLAPSVILFSLTVFIIWTFIPVTGYFIAKLFKAGGYLNKYALFIAGVLIATIENSLFHFKILTYEQSYIGVIFVFVLFFITAYISIGKQTNEN